MGDANFRQARHTLARLHKADDIDIKKFADEAYLESDEVRHVRHVLNFFEHISIGVKHGIYHEGIVKEKICNVLLDAWKMAFPYVNAREREQTPANALSGSRILSLKVGANPREKELKAIDYKAWSP